MTPSKSIDVSGFNISEELFPSLYKLGMLDRQRLEKVIKTFRVHCLESKDFQHILELIEKSQPVMILGKAIDAITYPAIYCWYKMNPVDFEKFFVERFNQLSVR